MFLEPGHDDQLFTTAEAAAFLRVSKAWLERDRCSGHCRVPYIKVSPRVVRYRASTLRNYLAERTLGGMPEMGASL